MEWDLDNSIWRQFFGATLPNFCQTFQRYIDDGTLIPGWHGGENFHTAGLSQHVSANDLKCLIPPGSVTKGLHPRNPDHLIKARVQALWHYVQKSCTKHTSRH
jgi:hypothetical protein